MAGRARPGPAGGCGAGGWRPPDQPWLPGPPTPAPAAGACPVPPLVLGPLCPQDGRSLDSGLRGHGAVGRAPSQVLRTECLTLPRPQPPTGPAGRLSSVPHTQGSPCAKGRQREDSRQKQRRHRIGSPEPGPPRSALIVAQQNCHGSASGPAKRGLRATATCDTQKERAGPHLHVP